MTYVHSLESSAPGISLQTIPLLLPHSARQISPYKTHFHQPGVAECQALFLPSWRRQSTFSFFSLLEKAEYLRDNLQGDTLADLLRFIQIGQDDVHILLDDKVGNLQLMSSFETLLFKSFSSTFLKILGCCLGQRKPKGERERGRERERGSHKGELVRGFRRGYSKHCSTSSSLQSLILGRVGRGKFQQVIEVLCLLQEEAKGERFSSMLGVAKRGVCKGFSA
ncbi:hypothetical protein MA16_Dca000241 [Dendrobium catenatum]|uniref:Uncharacterized protein n=1 Tax=Dendrobium catenatum TaxID=906689 RepID=A0A2I0WTB6_9ASPA|nr:hypothetical protein MA16_Dca000241 [Dendrobium catenatum]